MHLRLARFQYNESVVSTLDASFALQAKAYYSKKVVATFRQEAHEQRTVDCRFTIASLCVCKSRIQHNPLHIPADFLFRRMENCVWFAVHVHDHAMFMHVSVVLFFFNRAGHARFISNHVIYTLLGLDD